MCVFRMPPHFLHYMALSLDGQEVLLQPASKAFLILYGDNMEVLKSEWRYVQHDMRCRQAVGQAILQPPNQLVSAPVAQISDSAGHS